MELEEQTYKDWLLQLQNWASDGDLLRAGLYALQLKPGTSTKRLKRIANRLAKGVTHDLPPIELLPASAMRGAAGAYASSTKTIYINKKWLKSANRRDVITVLTEEYGHHLDDLFHQKDTRGDEGAYFAQLLLASARTKDRNKSQDLELLHGNDHGQIKVDGKWHQVEFQNFQGTSGDDNFNGTGSADKMYGYAGDDFLKGGGGIDYIYGGNDDDRIYDKWTGDRDTVSNYLFGGGGNDLIIGGNNKDILRGDGNNSGQEASIHSGKDTLKGHGGADLLTGGGGNDQLNGGSGYDKFDGGPGADIIFGGGINAGLFESVYQHDGDSLIWTNAGNLASSSTLINGESIIFGNGVDVIYDFNHAQYNLHLPNTSFNLLTSGDSLTGLTIGQNYFVRGSWSHSGYSNAASSYNSNNYSGTFTTGESGNSNQDYSFLVLYNAQATDFFSASNTNFLVLEFDYNGSNTTPSKHPTDMVAGINGSGDANDLNPLKNPKILINGPAGNAGDGSTSLFLTENTSAVHSFTNTGNS